MARVVNLLVLAAVSRAAVHEMIVGSFVSKNLYTIAFDDVEKSLSLIANFSVPAASSWIALNHDKTKLYGTDFVTLSQTTNNTIPPLYASYNIANTSHITTDAVLSSDPKCNGSSIYVVADHNPPYSVYGADFWAYPGCGTIFSVDESGALARIEEEYKYSGATASIHGAVYSPNSRFLYAADTRGDMIWVHATDETTGRIRGEPIAGVPGPLEGSRPRHIAIHGSGTVLYVVTEHTSHVATYRVDLTTGIPHAQPEQIISLLPEGADYEGYLGDTLALSTSGTWLWASTRGRGATKGYMAAYELDEITGAIIDGKERFLVQTSTSGGASNAVSPSGFSDRYAALTDNYEGFVEVWELAEDGGSAAVAARIDIKDQGGVRYNSGCCANVVWLN
ncbi:carboxy-cis,cis-muconate cyclase [Microdochium nivale]|nr:carboxy-cis,cis-muconate cyclase [Microdochium nivale]